ncbi:hypothetical protein UN64_07900 [Fictibacillus arsenicus]|uniref:Uncharacterized protein n=1 Tax=Fictibacillus arsenicus TaxID=255247 RepID=A0A1V3G6L9_9BACL|nr:hypothetical protein UN64_07900 [Fictibacillus arsenicus]
MLEIKLLNAQSTRTLTLPLAESEQPGAEINHFQELRRLLKNTPPSKGGVHFIQDKLGACVH